MKIGDSMWNYGLNHWISVRRKKKVRDTFCLKICDMKEKGVGEKLTVAAQNGKIDPFGSQGA